MADERDEEIAALKARLERLEGGTKTATPVNLARPVRKSGIVGKVVVIAGLLLLLAFCASLNGGSSTSNWTPPAGYESHTTNRGVGIGVKWVEATSEECRLGRGACFAIDVVTERDCPTSLYASITLLGDGNNNIGWTNDTAQGVQVGETTHLVFTTYEQGVTSARIADINCY